MSDHPIQPTPVCISVVVNNCECPELNTMSMLVQVMQYAAWGQPPRISPESEKRIAAWFADRYGVSHDSR